MNAKFISLKMQFDKKDAGPVYTKDIETIRKEIKVTAYPTYAFINPKGVLVAVETGYKTAGEFLNIARTALKPGLFYINPFDGYNQFVAAYNKGQKDYSNINAMIKMAQRAGEKEMFASLTQEYIDYLRELEVKDLFFREPLAFIPFHFTLKKNTRYFELFWNNQKRIDRIMGRPGYAASCINQSIYANVTAKVLGSGAPQQYIFYAPFDPSEGDWIGIADRIKEDYGPQYVDQNVMVARLNWYDAHNNQDKLIPLFAKYIDKYGFDTVNVIDKSKVTPLFGNAYAWHVFLYSDNKDHQKLALKWMKEALDIHYYPAYGDTYANLLYKMGYKKKGLKEERKAQAEAERVHPGSKLNKEYQDVIDKMLKDQPTWKVPKS